MRKIYETRHGQNEDNAKGILNGHRDEPLTDLGRAQARASAQRMKEENLTFDAVYTSPLCRASETAEIICDTLGIGKPIVLDDLIERDFGDLTGLPIADILLMDGHDTIVADKVTYVLNLPGGEPFPRALDRATRALDHVRARHADGSILLVAHGDIGKLLYASFYGLEWRDVLLMFHFGNCELVLLQEGLDPKDAHVVRVEQHNQ